MKKIIFLSVLLIVSCSKPALEPAPKVALNFIAVWFSGCLPPDTNTAIILLDDEEYIFDVVRNGTGYRSTNSFMVEPGNYQLTLVSLNGMHTMNKIGELNGAVVIPGTYPIYLKEGVDILFQVFCNS